MRIDWHRRYPLLLPSLALSAGLSTAASVAGLGTQSRVLFAVLLLSGVAWIFFRKSPLRLGLLAVCFFSFGVLRIGDHFFRGPPDPLAVWLERGKFVEVGLEAEDYGQSNGKRSVFPARILGYFEGEVYHPVDFRVRLTVGSPESPAIPGRRFRAPVQFREARNFKNPSSFDYARYLRSQGFWATGYVRGVEELRPWGREPPWYFSVPARFRARLLQCLQSSVPDPAARGVLAAMLVRETSGLGAVLADEFRRAGLTHLLVVSGLNFGLSLGAFFFPLYFILSLIRPLAVGGGARRLALGAALVPTFFYAAMVGLTPSVLRSLAMAVVLVLAALTRWRRDFFSVLWFCLLGLLLWRPVLFWDLSFRLSFISVAAVAIFSPQFLKIYQAVAIRWPLLENRILRYGLLLLATSLAVNLALYALLASGFHEVSLVGPVANLFYVPLFSWILLPGGLLGAVILGPAPRVAEKIFFLLGNVTGGSLRGVHELASLPGASILVPSLQGFALVAYGCFLLGIFQCSHSRRRRLGLGLALLCGALHCCLGGFSETDSALRLTMIDVGQGESLLLSTPRGGEFLLDGGGLVYSDFDIGRNILAPELLARGKRRLEAMILTHPDADHYKGFFFLLARWEVGEFWLSETTLRHPDFRPLRKILAEKKIPLRLLGSGDRFERGGVDFEVLWPPRGAVAEVLPDNDQSLVLRTCYGPVCFLLTGDIEAKGESRLLQGEAGRDAAVLKVAHHGSRSSTTEEWLRRSAPRLALISAGQRNRFHFPHPQVLARLAGRGVVVLSTDRDGQIEVETDGQNLNYRTFSGKTGIMGLRGSPAPSLWSAIRAEIFARRS